MEGVAAEILAGEEGESWLLQVLAKGGLTFGTTEDAEYTEEKGRVLLGRGRSVSLISSWRGLSLSVLPGRRGAARVGRFKVEGSRFSSEPTISTRPHPAAHWHTPGVLVFFAGMKGNPFGGVLFSHVPFFSGEVKFKEKSDCDQLKTVAESKKEND